jgi:DNA processing protein
VTPADRDDPVGSLPTAEGPGNPEALRAAAVALACAAGLDAPGLADRLEQHDPRAALAEELGAGTSLLPEDPRPSLDEAHRLLTAWGQRGLRCLSVRDPDYPPALHMVHDRPALLWLAGDRTLLGETPPAIAVVGTRHPSDEGLAAATALAADLVRHGFVVLSGLASGIDTAAHRAAIGAGGRTVAVIGTGHDHAYPRENAELQTELAREHAVVSPFWPTDPPSPERFRRRNGVMSGLGLGTVIVEASVRSGTRVQARLALAHGRPVFLLRPLLSQGWAAELARRPGVHVVEGAGDVLEIVRAALDPGPVTAG